MTKYIATVGWDANTRKNIDKEFDTVEQARAYAYEYLMEHPDSKSIPSITKINKTTAPILGYVVVNDDLHAVFWAVVKNGGYAYYLMDENGNIDPREVE